MMAFIAGIIVTAGLIVWLGSLVDERNRRQRPGRPPPGPLNPAIL
jgi:hypothetical protein